MKGNREIGDGFTVVTDAIGVETPDLYAPPIDIEYVLKTSSQVRIRYGAGEIIFNWEWGPSELRIDGGPASGQHQKNAGAIPKDELITIRQVVRPREMTIYVNDELRAKWEADFSKVKEPIGIKPHGSTLWLKHVNVRKPR